MSYAAQRIAARVIAVILGTLTLVGLADQTALGIPPLMTAWLPIVTGALGLIAGFLPTVQARGSDPDWLIDRIMELPELSQRKLARDLTERTLVRQHDAPDGDVRV